MTASDTATGPATASRPWWRHPAALIVGAAVLLVLVAAAVLWGIQRGRALPNTEVAGIEVGGMTGDEIAAAIDTIARQREDDRVTVRFEDERLVFTPTELGFRVDDQATVDAALGRGRRNPLARVTSYWRTHDVGLTETIDAEMLSSQVNAVPDEVDRRTDTGEVRVDADSLEVEVVLPAGAAEVRREETVQTLQAALQRPGPDEVELPADVEDPPYDPAEAERLGQQVEVLLEQPFELRGADQTLTVDAPQIARLVEVVVTADDDGLELVVTEDTVDEVLGSVARERFDRSPVSARYGTSRTPPTAFSEMGTTTWQPVTASASVQEGRDGREFDATDAAERLTEAFRAGDRSVETELITVRPDLPNDRAEELRPTHLLGTFTTAYTAGQTRVANIQRLADVVDDTQLVPGEEFSINGISGERACDKGYEPAGTIVRGEVVDTCGGGVSQFGTTTFNAAFFAGVQLDQWRAHSFYISRYPEGREATLSFPQLDVRFTNDTDGAIVVRASYTDTTVTVSLYGRPSAESVSATHGPRRDVREPTIEERTTSELPQGRTREIQSPGSPGFRVEVVRTVTYQDGSEDTRTITTRYEPQNGIVERGTG